MMAAVQPALRRSGGQMDPTERHPGSTTRYGWDSTQLPAWPLALPLVGYPVAWVIGISNLVWALAAVPMLAILLRTRGVRVPRGFGLWLLFLAWALCSLIMLDTMGRVMGAAYRLTLYASATVIAVYVFNSWRTLTARYVSGLMTWFLGTVTTGGYLAMAFPLLTIRTPISYVLPGWLASNELVREMTVVRATQWNPNAWIVQQPRPSAPFLYTNTWGNVYSLVLPFAFAYLIATWSDRRRRWLVLTLIIASLPPAVSTLNRGMFIGLGVVALWCAVQALRNGRVLHVLLGVAGLSAGVAAWLISPASEALFSRLAVTSSSEDRMALYRATISRTLDSPFFGFGAPRPSEVPWLPSMGTQGQLWMVMFSYGLVGAALFFGFFLSAFLRGMNRIDVFGTVCGAVVLATLVESLYYGMMTGINVSLIAAVLLARPDTVQRSISTPVGPRTSRLRSPIGLRRARE